MATNLQRGEDLLRVKLQTLEVVASRDFNLDAAEYAALVTLTPHQFISMNSGAGGTLMGYFYYLENIMAHRTRLHFLIRSLGQGSSRHYLSQIYTSKVPGPAQNLLVFFASRKGGVDSTVGKEELYLLACLLKDVELGITSVIIVTDGKFTHSAARCLAFPTVVKTPKGNKKLNFGEIMFTNYSIDVFNDEDLMINPREHVYVSQHRFLREDEKVTFLQENSLRMAQLPQFVTEDPIIKRMGGKPGTIVEVVRQSFTPGTLLTEELAYRGIYAGPLDPKTAQTNPKIKKLREVHRMM